MSKAFIDVNTACSRSWVPCEPLWTRAFIAAWEVGTQGTFATRIVLTFVNVCRMKKRKFVLGISLRACASDRGETENRIIISYIRLPFYFVILKFSLFTSDWTRMSCDQTVCLLKSIKRKERTGCRYMVSVLVSEVV